MGNNKFLVNKPIAHSQNFIKTNCYRVWNRWLFSLRLYTCPNVFNKASDASFDYPFFSYELFPLRKWISTIRKIIEETFINYSKSSNCVSVIEILNLLHLFLNWTIHCSCKLQKSIVQSGTIRLSILASLRWSPVEQCYDRMKEVFDTWPNYNLCLISSELTFLVILLFVFTFLINDKYGTVSIKPHIHWNDGSLFSLWKFLFDISLTFF